MPILDKLNAKLEEAGVEEHGRTIEEAVDLLPVGGGEGGGIDYISQETFAPKWPNGSGGGICYVTKIADASDVISQGKKYKSFIGALFMVVSGANVSMPQGFEFVENFPYHTGIGIGNSLITPSIYADYSTTTGGEYKRKEIAITNGTISSLGLVGEVTGFKVFIPFMRFVHNTPED